eukprot:7343556-Lingulodinium_polyedra.AAC.1
MREAAAGTAEHEAGGLHEQDAGGAAASQAPALQAATCAAGEANERRLRDGLVERLRRTPRAGRAR